MLPYSFYILQLFCKCNTLDDILKLFFILFYASNNSYVYYNLEDFILVKKHVKNSRAREIIHLSLPATSSGQNSWLIIQL